jgi:4-amino-4-deoxy-L-arabinose transferase-like glycosyltransferase
MIKFIIFLFFILLTLYRCFWNLGKAPFVRWDEGTNVGVISETLVRKSFPVLLYHGTPFFEKPPLWYYVNIPIAAIFGISQLSMRMISAAAGFAVILLTVLLALRWWGPIAGFVSWAVLLATNHLFVTDPAGIFSTHTFRSADPDALFILFIVASFSSKQPVWKGIFAGLAVLTKGPVGFIPLFTVLGTKAFRVAMGWALVVTAPWYVFMTGTFGNAFISAHIGYHLAERFITPIEGHANVLWYFAELLGNRQLFLSWELLVVSVVWLIVKKKLSDIRIVYVVLMTGILFLLPTLSRTKLAWYILPMYPFTALVIGAAASDISAYLVRFRTR